MFKVYHEYNDGRFYTEYFDHCNTAMFAATNSPADFAEVIGCDGWHWAVRLKGW